MVSAVLVSLEIAALVGGMFGQGKGDGFSGIGWQNGPCRLQCPIDGDGGGVACQQDSYLLVGCCS